MRVDVVVNTTARLFARRPSLAAAVERAAAGRANVHRTSQLADLERVANELAARGTDLVALSGGDGTFMAGVTALARAFGERPLPKIALLPGGTVATVARNFGMKGEPGAILEAMLARGDALETKPRATLRVRERDGAERVGFIFGTGLVAKFFDVYYADGARGYGAAAKIVARIFVESFVGGPYARAVLDPLACSISIDGRELAPKAWSLVCASVVRDLGIGMRVTYRGGEDPARPHLVASALSSRGLGPRAPLVLMGKRIGGKDHVDELVPRFTVTFPNDEPGPYVLDGDVFRARRVDVSGGPVLDVATL